MRHSLRFSLALLSAASIAMGLSFDAAAATFSFATYSWDQDDTPDTLAKLGNGAVLGGATFSSGLPSTTVGDVGFPDQAAGSHALSTFDTSLTVARSTGDATTANTARALNLPSGNNGTSTRHGVEFGWSGSRSFVNGVGEDFVLYESGSSMSSPENPMVRVRTAGSGVFSDWYYFTPDAFELYVGDATQGAFATAVDLSDMGLASGAFIDLIQIANLTAADRIVGTTTHSFGGQDFGIGRVVFDGSSTVKPDPGAFASFRDTGFGSGSLDPDPLYLGMLGSQVVPEPGSIALFGLAGLFGAVCAVRRRQR